MERFCDGIACATVEKARLAIEIRRCREKQEGDVFPVNPLQRVESMNAVPEEFLSRRAQVAPDSVQPFPKSNKVYVEGSRPDIRVPMREIQVSETPADFGKEHNPSIYVYDTSGPYTDPDVTIDIRKGLQIECIGCAACIRFCPTMATYMKEGRASINSDLCAGCSKCIIVCPEGTIKVEWNGAPVIDQEKMAEHALGVIYNKKRKSLFVNFITNVTSQCDCCNSLVYRPLLKRVKHNKQYNYREKGYNNPFAVQYYTQIIPEMYFLDFSVSFTAVGCRIVIGHSFLG